MSCLQKPPRGLEQRVANDGHSINTDRSKVNGCVAGGSRHEDQLMGYIPALKSQVLKTSEQDWRRVGK